MSNIRQASVDKVHFVYILKCADGSHYVGCSNNLNKHIQRHNGGKVKSTSYRLPVDFQIYLVFRDKYKAFKFEKYLKTGSGRAFMNKRLI